LRADIDPFLLAEKLPDRRLLPNLQQSFASRRTKILMDAAGFGRQDGRQFVEHGWPEVPEVLQKPRRN
jgi:hypothetical protein